MVSKGLLYHCKYIVFLECIYFFDDINDTNRTIIYIFMNGTKWAIKKNQYILYQKATMAYYKVF